MTRTFTKEQLAERKKLQELQQGAHTLQAFAADYLAFLAQLRKLVDAKPYATDAKLPDLVVEFRRQLGLSENPGQDIFSQTRTEYDEVVAELNQLQNSCRRIIKQVKHHRTSVWYAQLSSMRDVKQYQQLKRDTLDPETGKLAGTLTANFIEIQDKLSAKKFKPAVIAEQYHQTLDKYKPSIIKQGLYFLTSKYLSWLLPTPLFANEISTYSDYRQLSQPQDDEHCSLVEDLRTRNKTIRDIGLDSMLEPAASPTIDPAIESSDETPFVQLESATAPAPKKAGRLERRYSTGSLNGLLTNHGLFAKRPTVENVKVHKPKLQRRHSAFDIYDDTNRTAKERTGYVSFEELLKSHTPISPKSQI